MLFSGKFSIIYFQTLFQKLKDWRFEKNKEKYLLFFINFNLLNIFVIYKVYVHFINYLLLPRDRCTSPRVFPLVSGTILMATTVDIKQKIENIRNGTYSPNCEYKT